MTAARTWKTTCGEYSVRLTPDSWRQMESECTSAGSVETGGILVGFYTDEEATAVITEALPPPSDSQKGRSWFNRGVAGLKRMLVTRWGRSQRTYYVGEWHYHPAGVVQPSPDDLTQMREIGTDVKYQCREPIMMILGRAQDSRPRSVRAFVFPDGKRCLEFESAPAL